MIHYFVFYFYCEICDYGTFSVDLFNNHNESNKHKKYIERKNIMWISDE